MFLRDGFDDTSMEAVAQAVKIPKTTLYKRYPDKLALLNAVIVERVSSWSRITTPQSAKLGNDLRVRLIQHTAMMLSWTARPDVRAFAKLAHSAAGRSPSGAALDYFGYTEMIDFICKEITVYGPQCGIHARHPDRIAQAIMAMISGWLSLRGNGQEITEAEAENQARLIVELLMDGIKSW